VNGEFDAWISLNLDRAGIGKDTNVVLASLDPSIRKKIEEYLQPAFFESRLLFERRDMSGLKKK
jgi:hypothetical protein